MSASPALIPSLTVSAAILLASPATTRPAETIIDFEAQALAQELISQAPPATEVIRGVLKVTDENWKRTRIPFRQSVAALPDGWRITYETHDGADADAERLDVIHRVGKPNQYVYTKNSSNEPAGGEPLRLEGAKACFPFAGSDFWLADLGLEFLHWPEQRILRDRKINMRQGRPCLILESVNPNPTGASYSRVVSWIDSEYRGLIYAEAFDSNGDRFKVFSIGKLAKINGTYHVKEMKIENYRTDARTALEFDLEPEDESE